MVLMYVECMYVLCHAGLVVVTPLSIIRPPSPGDTPIEKGRGEEGTWKQARKACERR